MKLNLLLAIDNLPDDLTAVEFNAAIEAFKGLLRISGVTLRVCRASYANGRPFTGRPTPPTVNCAIPKGRPS